MIDMLFFEFQFQQLLDLPCVDTLLNGIEVTDRNQPEFTFSGATSAHNFSFETQDDISDTFGSAKCCSKVNTDVNVTSTSGLRYVILNSILKIGKWHNDLYTFYSCHHKY